MGTTNGNDWESDDDNQDEGQPPAGKKPGLREYAEQQKRENAELKAKLEQLEAGERKRTVETAITAKGFDPQIAELVPDSIASDASQLEKWLTEKATLFKTPSKQDETPVQQGYDDDDNSMDDDADAFGRMSRVSANALPPTKAADTMAAIKNAKSRAELDEVLRSFGNQNVG